MSDPMLRYPEVQRELGLSRSSIERLVRSGQFPRPRRLGLRAVAWPASEVERWKQGLPSNET